MELDGLLLWRAPFFGPIPPDFDPELNCVTLKSLLRAWNIQQLPADIPVLAVPFPLAFLVCLRQLSRLMVLARWHDCLCLYKQVRAPHQYAGPVTGWPPEQAAVWQQLGRHSHPQKSYSDPITSGALSEIATVMRRASRSLLDAGLGAECARGAIRVSQWSDDLDTVGVGSTAADPSGRFQHGSLKLIEAIRIACDLKGGANKVLSLTKRCINLAAPPSIAKTLLDSRRV